MEATLNGLLDAEADQLCGAKRYERSADRVDTRAGSYDRKLQTKAGEVTLEGSSGCGVCRFETQIIERYRRRESSVEEALMEMYLGGRERPPGGGYYRGVVGHPSVAQRGKRAESAALLSELKVAKSAD